MDVSPRVALLGCWLIMHSSVTQCLSALSAVYPHVGVRLIEEIHHS